jgi:hypothetical protein
MQFSEKKAAQVAAFFLHRAGGRMEKLKLMKLMYLAERASYQKFGEPMVGDKLVSMDNGPALSITLNHMNRIQPSEPEGWESWVSHRSDYVLALAKPVRDPKEDLLQLSDGESACYNGAVRQRIEAVAKELGVDIAVRDRRDWYF